MANGNDEDGDLLIKILFTQDFTLKFVYLLQLLFSLIALSCLIVVVLQLCSTRRAFTLTIRILVVSLCSALTTLNIGILLSSAYHLHMLVFRPVDTWYYWMSFTNQDCLFIKTIPNIALFSTYASSLTFAIERIVSSLMLQDMNSNTKNWMAGVLILLQWSGSIVAGYMLPLPPTQNAYFAHCSTNILMPTQIRQFFYIILGMQCFVLSIYSVLTYHHTTPLVISELKRFNFTVYENIASTEQTLPLVASIVGLFVCNVTLDENFVFTVWSMASGMAPPSNSYIRKLAMNVKWAEYQTLLMPFISLVVVAILILRWSEKDLRLDAVYEHVANLSPELMQTIEDFYENQSEAMSTCTSEGSSKNSKLSCKRNVDGQLQGYCKNMLENKNKVSPVAGHARSDERRSEKKVKKAELKLHTSIVSKL